ncbi:hypothetical protein KGM_208159 [Danaus plexippus plexippus]|uniref:Regulation of nuclear pre-mRNA domain-containing protein 2 n=1 Tax=Danaus plexippus plexippus TaxID=278856 RepID=A0A212F1D3_DANPL|nr:hypothetical protein KGM_208159 [Danaus plexippus plexippus]
MGETEEFNTLAFEKKLTQLKDTQESIQSLSSWCLKQRTHHKKIVSSWLNVLKRVKVEQRLVLFYLANDVIQYSKRKNYEFVESWGLNLQKATPLVRDEKVRPKILRIFKIWEQRSVYDDEFLSDLTGLLSAGAVKKTDDDPLDFQATSTVGQQDKTVYCARSGYSGEIEIPLELSDTDALCSNLKERSSKDDVEKELNEGIQCVERYTQALQREIVAREALLALLSSANQYYSTQRGEVKVVAYAYKNFGSRVRALKRKLDELLPTLPSAPSPPTRDEDVPSPGPDEDLELPTNENEVSYNIDQTFNTSVSADGSLYNLGLSSFLNENSMAIFNESQADLNIVNSSIQPDTLPGLDLLKESNPPPPTSFYGTMETITKRSSKDDVEKELNEGIQCVERYTQALQREIVAREALLALLSSANQYYSTQRGEVKVVAYAYKNFGSRVRALKRKLDELLPTLPSAPSPPTRDEDVPSPGPDEDLELPTNENEVSYNIDQTFNTSVSADGSLYNLGLSSFLNENSMAIFNESQADLNIVNSSIQPDTLPGLDLLKESNPPPPTSFYGTMETITIPDEPDQPYLPEAVVTNSQWANNTWNVPLPVARNVFAEPPASPPVPIRTDTQVDISASDHELRSRLPPPPPPPVLPGLTHIEDVDHRLLPSLPPTPVPPPIRHSHQDVDHRNLISLTQLPPRHVNVDQDYRLPPLSQPLGVPLLPPPPSDIVESVDMDLSEDEEQGMYQTQNQSDHRHNSFNNNKVLVGGEKKDNSNLIQINANIDIEAPHGTPVAPMTNPFDNMPPQLRYNFNTNYQKNPDNAEYNDDIRNRNLDRRNQSPEYEDYKSNDFQAPRPYMNRFPRNWGPRNNFRAPYNQFNQRNGGPRQRWGGPRQRFW